MQQLLLQIKKRNLFTCRLGVTDTISENFGDSFCKKLNISYQKNVLVLLIIAIIKYCKVVSKGWIDLYLCVFTKGVGPLLLFDNKDFS